MEIQFCPKCRGKLKPIYKERVVKDTSKDEYRTLDGAIPSPPEQLCEPCKEIFRIEVVGIIC